MGLHRGLIQRLLGSLTLSRTQAQIQSSGGSARIRTRSCSRGFLYTLRKTRHLSPHSPVNGFFPHP